MSVLEPFSIGVVPVLRILNARLLERLNAEPNQGALWRLEIGKLACSRAGAMRVIWKIIGGPTIKGACGTQAQDAVAPVIATRSVGVEAQIRAIDPRSSGITDEDQNMAEKVQRQILFVTHEIFSGDNAEDGISEVWDGFTDSPAQGEVVLAVRFSLRVLVHGDPYLIKRPSSMEQDPHNNIPAGQV